jgi:hypothetical protein
MIIGDITIKINISNIDHFTKLGFSVQLGDEIKPTINDLTKGSNVIINTKCDICNSSKSMMYKTYYKITNQLKEPYYCHKCSFEKSKITNIKKYGCEHPMKNKNVVDKLIKTNNEKYGKNSASMLDKYKKMQENTNIKRYGNKCPLQNDNVKIKTKQTNIIKFGYDHPMKNKNNRDRAEKTREIKYNDKNYNNRVKCKKTNIEKYGVINPAMNKDIIKKINITKSKILIKKYPSILSVDYLNKKLIMKCDNNKEHNFEIDISIFQNRKKLGTTICTVCNDGVKSGLEIELFNFIKDNYNRNIIENDRKLIGKELDVYLPDLKLAFEFNGLYWHNEINKPSDYHKIKTNLCNEKDIQLIHIYEDDWIHKQDIVKSMILNKLNLSTNKIFARKTQIIEISDNKSIRDFLNNNHIQGFTNSQIKIGLYYNTELVSIMLFGKKRKSINSKSNNNEYEMLRFCNKLNTVVIGGASKLFNYFIKTYNPTKIISYADRSYSNGNLYRRLGFTLDTITKPNYYYIINGIKKYKSSFTKSILVKQGYDKNMTEHQIMIKRKISRIYDSGNYKFIFTKLNHY